MSYYGWAPYVPVAERRAKAQKQLEKKKRKGLNVQPVQLSGRKIAASFWGKGWSKHIAAVLYGVGARLDHSPELLFHLRGVNHEELVDVSAVVTGVAKAGTSRRRIAASGLADVFGVEMAEAGEVEVRAPAIASTKRLKTSTKLPDKLTVDSQLQKKQSPTPLKNGKKTSVSTLFPEPLTGNDIYT